MTGCWIEALAEAAEPDTDAGATASGLILAIGPVCTSLLAACRRTRAARIVILDPDPATPARTIADPRILLLEQVPGPVRGSAVLNRYNLPGLAGVHAPTGLRDLYPGLRVTARIDVAQAPLAELLEGIDLSGSKDHQLLLMPGAFGQETLAQLEDGGYLDRFARIFAHLPASPLHAGGLSGADLRNRLIAAGFRVSRIDRDDPDLCPAVFERDPVRAELQKALAERDAARAEIEKLGARAERRAAEYRQNLAEKEELLSQRTAQAEKFRDEARAAQAALETARSETRTARDALAEKTTALEARKTDNARLQSALQAAQAKASASTADPTRAREELRRAEGQIALIRDLLLREPDI